MGTVTQKGNIVSSCNDSFLPESKETHQEEPLPKKVTIVTQKGNESLPKKVPSKEKKERKKEEAVETEAERSFRNAFDAKESWLKSHFPKIDFEIEREKCVHYYQNKPSAALDSRNFAANRLTTSWTT